MLFDVNIMNKIEISIIMGVYNCANTLQDALDSIYTQTFKEFEIVVCNDGSTDCTSEILKKNSALHDEIVILENSENRGLNYSLNRCLAVSKGRYIARMDGDDISLPERLKTEYLFLESHPEYAIVSIPMQYFDEHGIYRIGKVSGEPRIEDFVKGTPFCHAPSMVRKIAYDDVGGYSESKKLLRVEDYHLWMKMYLKGYKGFRLNKPLYMMRDDRNALVRRNFRNRINETYVKYLICKNFHLPLRYYLYCLKPLVIWLLPTFIYNKVHRRQN